ncbi:magnesium transporter CorA family protein [Candidatus Woesearchaeota archaeon]|nr:magnesium transporter CorA family protein [Candidatus Woesearchaeota archaeon]
MITFFKRETSKGKLHTLLSFENDCWIHVTNPDERELELLENTYKLDRELIEAALDENELPRFDSYEQRNYIFIKTVNSEGTKLATLLIALSENFILTLTRDEPPFLHTFIDGTEEFSPSQKRKFLLKMLFLCNDDMERATIRVVRSVQRSRKTAEDLKDEDMSNLLVYEDFLNNLVSTYYYANLLYLKLLRKVDFVEDDKASLDDLIVESTQGMNTCRASLKTISNVRDYHTAVLTNRLNKTIKVLTIFTIFITIPAAISGVYGMNVVLPGGHNDQAFWYIITFIIILWSCFFYFLKKKSII